MNVIATLIERNEVHATGFDGGSLPAPPTLKIAIVTCMDARLDPARALGLVPGDAHVIRNAGGIVTDDVIRSLSISQHKLGTEAIMVVQHTDCGLLTFTDEDFERAREQSTGLRPAWSAGTFEDLETSVRDSLRAIRESPFVPRTDNLRGFVYEVEDGGLREVT
ncbi:MAG TPA: carbonic anhydrase [Solirubrobacteraceae bacterium]|nr:carbonic anhydrase [Solirubrobacteraceae bacterium]